MLQISSCRSSWFSFALSFLFLFSSNVFWKSVRADPADFWFFDRLNYFVSAVCLKISSCRSSSFSFALLFLFSSKVFWRSIRGDPIDCSLIFLSLFVSSMSSLIVSTMSLGGNFCPIWKLQHIFEGHIYLFIEMPLGH